MELNDIFLLYGADQPRSYEIKDTSRDDGGDFRQTLLAQWEDRKLVVKITCNDFTTVHRVEGWRKAVEAYRAIGYYCPQIVLSRAGNVAEEVEYGGRPCLVFAEEFSIYKTAEQFGWERITENGRFVYHDAAVRFIADVGAARLDFADFPSGLCLMECFCPSDARDEIMDCALDAKEIIEKELPQYRERFGKIWDNFMENYAALAKIYGQLPTSVFQADLNETNILLDGNLQFKGVLDMNLCGRDATLNILFREAWINFDEDVPKDAENNMFYIEETNEKAFRSFAGNLLLMKKTYKFSEAEAAAAPLLYRYLRPFWWQGSHALNRDKGDGRKVERILSWMEAELAREIDFAEIML